MSVINGVAKKYDGSPIDYVSIFNWADGQPIAKVMPDGNGAWEYEYFQTLNVGLLYVADGCQPLSHGAYDFIYEAPIPMDTILNYPFNGDVLDKSANALDGIKTGNATFVAGRKAGTQALEFIAGSVQTPQVLPINNDKITISFWMSTNQNSEGVIYECGSPNNTQTTGFLTGVNVFDAGYVVSYHRQYYTGDAVRSKVLPMLDFKHIIIEIDKSRPVYTEQKIYIDNIENWLSHPAAVGDTNGFFKNHILSLGSSLLGDSFFEGKIQDFRVYNRILSSDERTQLFNE